MVDQGAQGVRCGVCTSPQPGETGWWTRDGRTLCAVCFRNYKIDEARRQNAPPARIEGSGGATVNLEAVSRSVDDTLLVVRKADVRDPESVKRLAAYLDALVQTMRGEIR